MNVQSSLPADTTAAIISVLEEFVNRWNAKDAQAFGEIFTEEAEFSDIVGQVALNRQEVIDQHRFPFAVVNKLAVLSLEQVRLRALTTDLVMVTGQWQVLHSTTPTGQQLPPRNGVVQIICKRGTSHWAIRLVHNTDLTGAYRDMKTKPNFGGIEHE